MLTRLRMIRALELVSGTRMQILQIANECGFKSLSAFNRAFRRFTGLTPTAFRSELMNR